MSKTTIQVTNELHTLLENFTDGYHVKSITRTGTNKLLIEFPSGDRFELKVTSS